MYAACCKHYKWVIHSLTIYTHNTRIKHKIIKHIRISHLSLSIPPLGSISLSLSVSLDLISFYSSLSLPLYLSFTQSLSLSWLYHSHLLLLSFSTFQIAGLFFREIFLFQFILSDKQYTVIYF